MKPVSKDVQFVASSAAVCACFATALFGALAWLVWLWRQL